MHAIRWSRKHLPPLGGAGLVLMLVLGTGCAGFGPIRSQVLDAQTKQPIPGAIVLGVWTKRGGVPGLPITDLVGVREAETDAEGRFEMERPGALGVEERVTVYKFGHVAWNNELVFPPYRMRPSKEIPAQILLDLFPSALSHQEHMIFIRSGVGSGLDGSENNPKFRKAIERESRMP